MSEKKEERRRRGKTTPKKKQKREISGVRNVFCRLVAGICNDLKF